MDRTCANCRVILTEENWPRFLKEKTKTTYQCRPCYNAYHRARRQARPEITREQQGSWRDRNQQKWLWHLAKKRALDKNIAFEIDPEDIVIPENCPALGIKLARGTMAARDSSPSLDRIRPELGYVKGNVAVISFKANQIKSNAGYEDIIAVGEWLRDMCVVK